jgi:hypothetical protein
MGDINDPEIEDADAGADPRSDLQQMVDARTDALARGEGGDGESPLEPTGMPDGIGGTAGITKNQDDDAQ